MNAKMLLVLGTTNRKKGEELAALIESVGLEVKSLAEFPGALVVEETGDTFAANAALKATQQARHLCQWVLAEDSGLAVDALDGAPGVYSARFAGPDATDEANNRLLMERLAGIPIEKRTAHYVCHMTLCDPTGAIRAESEGICRGRITLEPRGTHGFGYDPLFEVIEYHQTFGTLGPVVKTLLSHRARAARKLLPAIAELVDLGQWTAG